MRRTNRPTKFGKVSNGFATASGNTLSWLTILCPLKVCGQPKHCWLKAGWNVFYSAVPLAALPTPFLPTPHPPAQCTWWTQTELRSTVWDKDHRPKKLRRALMSMPICRNRSAFRDPESRTARKTHHEKQTNLTNKQDLAKLKIESVGPRLIWLIPTHRTTAKRTSEEA